MQVGELFLALGLFVDEKEWNLGQAMIDKMTVAMKKLAVDAMLATNDVKKAMDVIGLPAVTAKTNLQKIADAGGHVESTFKRMLVAAAGFFALNGLKEVVMGVVDLGSKLNDTAQKTGLSAEELQWWGYAAKQNSSDMDGVVDGAKKLVKGLGNISKDGTDPASKGFRALGISLDDPAIKAKDLNGIMMIVANKFSTMPDGMTKSQIAMDLFGKSGEDLIPTLNNGVQGIMAYRKEANDLGAVMSGKTASGLDDLGDNIDRVKAAWQGVKTQAVAALLPMLAETVQKILDWTTANRALIADKIASVVNGIVTALKLMGTVLGFAIDHWQALVAIFAAMTIVKGMMAIVRAIIFFQSAQAAAAAESIGAWIAILGPILLIAAAIVGLGALIYIFRDKIWGALQAVGRFFAAMGRTVAGVFEGIWNGITSAVSGVVDGIKSGFRAAFEFVSGLPVISQLMKLVENIDGIEHPGRAVGDALFDATHDTGADQSLDSFEEGKRNAANHNTFADRMGATSGPSSVGSPMFGGSVPVNGGPMSSSILNTYSIQINAGAADAKEVGVVLDQKLREHDEKTRRQTAASLGV